MNEIEKLDCIVNHLVKAKGMLHFEHLNSILNLDVRTDEARYLCDRLIKDDVVEKMLSPMQKVYGGIRYTHNTLKFQKDGGYVKFEIRSKDELNEQQRRKFIEDTKLHFETTLAKWQVRTFWPVFIFGIIGGICGIVSLVMQIIDKK